MKIVILDEAEDDLAEGYIFYEEQEVGIGDYFLDSLFSDIDSLLVSAGLHPKKFENFRMLSKRFPFGIYYTITENVVSVHAVLDLRRDPAWIRDRLID